MVTALFCQFALKMCLLNSTQNSTLSSLLLFQFVIDLWRLYCIVDRERPASTP